MHLAQEIGTLYSAGLVALGAFIHFFGPRYKRREWRQRNRARLETFVKRNIVDRYPHLSGRPVA